jgi:hypothetical protein
LPPIFGYQLKLTDALVILSGFLLFFATFALYLATRSLVKSADNNAQTQLRAYVSVVPTSISTINPFSVALCFKNHGKTPAHDECFEYGGVAVWEDPLPAEWSIPQTESEYVSRMVLHNDAPGYFGLTHERALTSEEIKQVTDPDSNLRIYVYGSRTYRDVFGHPHFTQFCRFFRPNDALRNALNCATYDSKDLQFQYSAQHNEST